MERGNKVIGELIIILVGNKNVILLVFSELFIKRVINSAIVKILIIIITQQ